MLVLHRRIGEIIRINDDISVTVLGYHGQQIKLGVEAPRGVEIHRQEVYERIQAERRSGGPQYRARNTNLGDMS